MVHLGVVMAAFLGCFALLTAFPAWSAQPEPAAENRVLRLSGTVAKADMLASLQYVVDADGVRSVEEIDQLPSTAFAPVTGQPLALGDGALWQRFDAIAVGASQAWWLAVPLPALDEATLYYRDSGGQWHRQEAGDSRAMSRWALKGRYPVFSLPADVGVRTRYYLQVRHSRVPYSALPFVIHDHALINLRQNEHMLLGIYFGLATLAIVLATANAIAYRDAGFATFALYVSMHVCAQSAITGVAALYWWPELPQLNNPLSLLFFSLSVAAALWFVNTVAQPQRVSPLLGHAIRGLIVLVLFVGVLNAAVLNDTAFLAYNVLLSSSVLLLAVVIIRTARDASAQLRWLALAFVPVAAAAVFPLLRNRGVIESGFLTQHALMIGLALGAPIMFYGLFQRLTQRLLPSNRAKTLQTIDPLTGLHVPRVLLDKLRHALSSAERQQQPFAILMVNLVNLGNLQQQHGREIGERALVMAAARIRAVARPTDTVARAGDTQFALLMDGPVTAILASEIATKILASGLRPSDGLPDEEPLQFHIAVGHLDDMTSLPGTQAEGCFARMLRAVGDMNDGSRKAIRRVQL